VNTQGTIVVVEDDAHICDLVDMLLRAEGYRVIQAGDGATGLAAIERERPRVAILDAGLPDTDGLEVVRRLRNLPGPLARWAWSSVPTTTSPSPSATASW